VDSITNTFTLTWSGITNVWLPGGSFGVDVDDASGPSWFGHTMTNYIGILDIQATATNPFIINLASLDGSVPGLATNFDRTATNIWTIAMTTRGVTGFDPDKFVINDHSFSNDLAGGTFTVALSSNGLSVNVIFLPNFAPVANAASYSRGWGTFIRIPITNLVAGFTSDGNGDGRALVAVGSSTNGSWMATNSLWISLAPTNNVAESFPYVVRDTRSYRPGDTVLMATNWLTVLVTNAVGTAQTISISGPNVRVMFAGVPGWAYDVERTTNLAGGTWIVLQTTNAPAHGVWEYLDTNPPSPSGYYRIKQH
jgi:hypothetical protein